MRSIVKQVILALTSVLAAAVLVAAGDPPPPWAYGFADAAPATPSAAAPAGGRAGAGGAGGAGGAARGAAPAPAAPADTSLKQVPGSTASFTLAQIRDGFGPADWFPGDHPTMPEIVAHGKRPDVRACSLCHYPNGKGRPENAGVAGLPVSYFIQTMNDFRNDARKSADARKANTNAMITIAKGMTEEEIKAAAEYFGAMKWTPWIKVVETNMAIGQRIIEAPDDTERTETLRDPHSGFTAFVPVGSVKKGETLVTSGGGGKTTACAVCHGADLRGLGPVPGIAGRSPSYMVRQLYDMQAGIRKGVWSDLMKPVVAKLTNDDMLAIAAYAASK
jgi:cytochrome c553